MKALHLASFNGNIGDIANHRGFWNLFDRYVDSNTSVTNVEIREYYKSWGLRHFDSEFVDMVNDYDLLVIGGGCFFDIKWDYSRTGTTIDLPESLLEKIKIPIVYNGLGVKFNREENLSDIKQRFGTYLEYLCKRERTVVSVRNDDSLKLLEENYLGFDFRKIIQIPDGGFFTEAKSYYHPEMPEDKTIIAINVANDDLLERWNSKEAYELYCKEFALFFDTVLKDNDEIHFVFVPHIPSDIHAIWDVLKSVRDCDRRRKISIAPYLNGLNTSGDYLIDLYRKATVTIGMRYHSNICSIAMGTPTIGIVTLEHHEELYRNIGMDDRLFNVKQIPFCYELCERLFDVIGNKSVLIEQNKNLISRLEKETIPYFEAIKNICFL